MTVNEMFDKCSEVARHNDFSRLDNKRHPLRDLCGLLYLHEKLGGEGDAICVAEHDEVWLGWSVEQIDLLTEEDIRYLVTCGVHFDSSVGSLHMFV
jgi:hypothetical protein